MSFDYNYKFWVATKKDINDINKRQNVLKKLRPIQNPLITYKIFSELFVLYVELVNKLSYVYSKTFQVQKRAVVRTLVESATRRLSELKNELKNLEFSEYIYTDKALIARKLTPNDLIIWRSPQFLFKRPPELQNILYDNKIFMNDEEKNDFILQQKTQQREAIILLQAHERARRARVYRSAIMYDKSYLKVRKANEIIYKFTHKPDQAMSILVKRTVFNANFIRSDERCRYVLNVHNLDEKKKGDHEDVKGIRNRAAKEIQRAWRNYRKRKIKKNKYMMKQVLYGLKTKRRIVNPNKYTDSIIEAYKDEVMKRKLDEDFIKLMTDERTRLLQVRGPWIMEDISDHIRAWFREFYEAVDAFHPYPDIIKNGTVLVLIDETMTPLEFQESLKAKALTKEEKKKLAEKAALAKKKEKEKRLKEKRKEAKRKKKMKDAGIYDIADALKTNKNIAAIEKTMEVYSRDWRFIDEYLNKNHDPIKEWVTESELAIIHRELRLLVDEYMRIEHQLLEAALAKDKKMKYKKPKSKKPKQKKGKRKKKVKDMTEHRSIESLYNELKEAGIIEKIPRTSFADYIGEFNFVADDTRDDLNLTTLGPAKGDIKMVIQEAMLGMGEFTVDKPKSMLLFGPLSNGKKLLCNIIASELDAVFMNLSPEKTVQFEDNLPYLIHVVMKVAKAFQPAVLFINDVHRVFWKKIPPDQQNLNPKLLAKSIAKKILKPIKKDDKILLLGTSDAPWSAKKLKKIFQKIIMVSQYDYGSSFLLWLEFMDRHLGDNNVPDYAISSLAKVMKNYNGGDVVVNMEETLNVRRKMRLSSAPVEPSEFIDYFFADENAPKFPLEQKILDKYNKWFAKSNKMAILRRKFLNKPRRGQKKKK